MELNYNVTGAKRKELVMAIAELTGFAAEYLKAPTMAYQVGDYHISKEGTLSWPDTDDSQILSQREHLMEQLLERGFEAEIPEADTVDGIAISMPRSMFDETALQNLQNLVVAKQELLKRAFQVEELKLEITEETVGFPWFLSEPDSMEHYTLFVQKICEMAIKQKRIQAKEKEVVNEKYEFRCFLLRLGLIGDSYKAARKFLMKNLFGSAAFKNGKKKEVETE